MLYPYRFLIAFGASLLIIVIVYFYILQPALATLKELRETKKHLLVKFTQQKAKFTMLVKKNGGRTPFLAHQNLTPTASIPLAFIRLAGYLQQGTHIAALLLLPNSEVITAERGGWLGKEQGVIVAIHPHQVVVALPDHTLWTLLR